MRGWDQIIKTGKNYRTKYFIICVFYMTLMKARIMKCAGNVTPLGKLQNVISKTQGRWRCSNSWLDHINIGHKDVKYFELAQDGKTLVYWDEMRCRLVNLLTVI